MAADPIHTALAEFISILNCLNGSDIQELDEEPSPLEFMRFVARNTPFVIRGGASSRKACHAWDSSYLKSALKGKTVNVAVTPHGHASRGCRHRVRLHVFRPPDSPLTRLLNI